MNTRSITTLLIISLLVIPILVVGCGGDGDDDDVGPTGGHKPHDKSAPNVLSTAPEDADDEIALGAVVEVTFDVPMNPTSVEGAFTLDDSQTAVAGSISWDGTDETMTFTPDADLKEDTWYSASITTAATNADGAAMATQVDFSFNTIDLWTVTYDAAVDLGDSFATDVAVDNNGNIYVIGRDTVDSADPSSVMKVWVYDKFGNYLDGYTRSTSESGNYTFGEGIKADDSGNTYFAGGTMITTDKATSAHYIYVAKVNSAGDTVWEDTVESTATDGRGFGWDIDVDDTGNVYVAGVLDVTDQGNNAWYGKWLANGTADWSVGYDGADGSTDEGHGIHVGADGYIYATGQVSVAANTFEAAIGKFSAADGTEQFFVTFNADFEPDKICIGNSITTDTTGNIYIAGLTNWFSESSDNQWFGVWQYDSTPELGWQKLNEGPENALSDLNQALDIAPFEDMVVTVGMVNPTDNSLPFPYLNAREMDTGTLIWSDYFGERGELAGVAITESGVIYVAGYDTGYSTGKNMILKKYDKDGNHVD